jgi:hypothetical protein
LRTQRTVLSEEDRIDLCKSFLHQIDIDAKCLPLRRRRGVSLSCTCLDILKDSMAQEVVLNYMNYFYKKSRTDRILTVMDWIRYTARGNGIKPMHYLPFSNDDSSEYVDDDERKELMKILSVHKV